MGVYYRSVIAAILFLITLLSFLVVFDVLQAKVNITPYAILDQKNTNETLQQYPNMRFASRIITYTINNSCSQNRKQRIRESFNILENETGILTFVEENENGKISIECDETKKRTAQSHVKLGEGGVNEIVKVDDLYIINRGKITYFHNEDTCAYPNVEIHEILHVLGFKHAPNPLNIMYNFSNCNQRIPNEIKEEIQRLYKIPELSELKIDNVTYQKDARFVAINLTVTNQGIRKAENTTLKIRTPQRELVQFNIGDLEYGSGKSIKVTNLNVGREQKITLEIIGGLEIDLDNNIYTLFF